MYFHLKGFKNSSNKCKACRISYKKATLTRNMAYLNSFATFKFFLDLKAIKNLK